MNSIKDYFKKIRKNPWPIFSVISFLLILIDIFYKNISINSILLLTFSALPWIFPLLKSMKLPGGIEIQMRDLEKISAEAAQAGMTDSNSLKNKPNTMAFLEVGQRDPNLALAGFRIEIEKRLNELARIYGIDKRSFSLNKLLIDLNAQQAINNQERSVLSDLIPLLNRAAHGAEVPSHAIQWAMDLAPGLLGTLDERINQSKMIAA